MNNNSNNNTMNNNDNSNDNDNSYGHSINATAATKSTPAENHQPGASSALYKLAARNLREYHGVPSMTALKLEKTMGLLRLAPRRLVVQGLAPRRLLKGGPSPLVLAGEDASDDNHTSSSSEEEKGVSDDSDSMNDDHINNVNKGDDTKGDVEVLEADGNGKARRPIHAALVSGGINLRPRETKPLLCALGVKPHRLVRLGLVKREAVRAMPGGRGGGPGQRQHLRAGGPCYGGVGRPRGPPHGPPHDLGGRPMHGPPRPFQGDGHHTMHLGEESEGEGTSAPLGPHGAPGHRGPRHKGGRLQGPPHGRGPPGGGKHRRGHPHPPHGQGQGHGQGRSEGEEGMHLHQGAPGPEQHGLRRRGGGMGRSHSPPHGPFQGPFHEEGAPGAPHGMMAHPHHGPPSRGGGMKQRGGRQRGAGCCGGGGGGGGGHRQHGRMAHLAHFDGHQPQLETYY